MRISNCCGAEPRGYSDESGAGDQNTADFGICADCGEPCDYIEVCDQCCEEKCICDENREPAKIININQQ